MSICRMGESGLAIRLAHAQYLVITEDREQGFSKTGPYFSVYAVIVYKYLFVNCRH